MNPLMRRSSSVTAFTLVEMLVVIAIIGTLSTMSISALKSASPTNLVNSGNLLSGLMNHARIYAIANNTQAAVYICQDWPGRSDYAQRAASVWYADLNDATNPGTWKQLSKWEVLPTGIVVENATPTGYNQAGNYYGFDTSSLANSETRSIGGQSVKLVSIRFNSLGATVSNNVTTPIQELKLRLSPGIVSNGNVVYTQPGGSGVSSNWVDVATDGLTGRVRSVQR